MTASPAIRPACVAVVLGWACVAVAADASPSLEQEAFFEAKVRPLLAARCQECHGGTVAEAGLRLDTRRGVLKGSDTGPVVVAGKPAESRLVAAVKHAAEPAMPPDGRLSPDEVAVLETWVASGMPWSGPGGETAATPDPQADMPAFISHARGEHWAFRPFTRHAAPELPAGFDPAWGEMPVDRFVAAGIAAAGVTASPEAAPRDLVRRLFYDLTGLPPSAEEADAFVADPSESAYRALVDRLLASRGHAEHWARRWLDIARYADTMGYAFDNQDPRYPFAWTYRDWVVAALEADMPYDRFVTLQLAADRVQPSVPPADLAALGFLTVGRTFLGNQHDIIDDRIDLVTRGLMGLSVACARCHDHKYEPVSMADYYGLHGIFASCQIPEELPEIGAAAPGPEADAFVAKLAALRQEIVDHEAAVHARGVREAVAHAADYFLEAARPRPRAGDGRPPRLDDGYDMEQLIIDRMTRLLKDKPVGHPVLGPWAAVAALPDAEVGPRLAALLAEWGQTPAAETANPLLVAELQSASLGSLADVAAVYARLVARVAPACAGGPAPAADEPPGTAELRSMFGVEGAPLVVLRSEAMRIAKIDESRELRRRKMNVVKHCAEAAGGPPRAMVLVDQSPHDSRILLRGNPGRPGDVAKRRVPTVLGGGEMPADTSGRLELARAIAAADNPLTARVLVNWVWTHHVGRGLVETPGDFGLRGERPTHPALLDDLTRRWIDEGRWSLRWLHREILTSRFWRQASGRRVDLDAIDPENRLLARAERRRLDWEAWRDSLLVAAGTLDPAAAGGPGMNPLDVASMPRRTVYSRLDRQDVPGMLRIFDIANPDTAVHVRTRTSVPQQSLAVLNSPLVVEAATRIAARSAGDGGDAERVDRLWRIALARSPAVDERQWALDWLAAETQADAAGVPGGFDAWARLAQAVVATAEFQFVD